MTPGDMPLLEREAALASIAEYAQDARRGEGRLVLVNGEAGVGKSTLVERAQRDLTDARWLWSACDGLFVPRPLGPLFDLAEELEGELFDLCHSDATRDELFVALLRQLNEPGLSVVVVEDAHWADEATVDLLRFLGRRIRDAPVLLIVTYRDEVMTATDPLRVALGDLATQRSTRRIGLAPLSEHAVGVLAEGSGLEASHLYGLTGGNPYFISEVIQAGIDEVPPSARDAVLTRVARLSSEAREVLDVAALIGTGIEQALLESVAACSASILTELLESGLLIEESASLRFRHEIARLAVEQSVASHLRVPIHARILDALCDLDCDDDARLAFHAEAAADRSAVLRYAPRAARRAADLASHREAAAQYERAVRFAADPAADAAMVAGLYEGLAYELSLIDRWQDAADSRERALELWRAANDLLHEGDTLRRLSRTMWRLSRGDQAAAAAERAVTILEPLGATTELAWAYSNLATQRMLDSQHDEAITLARRAQELADRLSITDVLSDALNTEGCALACGGGDWASPLRRALEIALSGRHEELAGRAYSNLYAVACAERRFAEAERYYVDGIAYCGEHDITTFGTCLRGERSAALETLGHWRDSVALSEVLLRRAGTSPINRINSLLSLGRIRARRGDPAAWTCLDEAQIIAEGSAEPQWIVPMRLARAEAHWLEGSTTSATRDVELADDWSSDTGAWERGAVAAWLNRLGSDRPQRGELAEPYRLQFEGEWQKAAEVWTDLGCPYEVALVLSDAAAEAPMRQALGILDGLQASATARIIRRQMRRLGIRSIPVGARRTTRAHPNGLTRREGEVLDLIVAGHSNTEIADRLVISPKTVDHHVSAVLAKLNVSSRHAAASVALELGLLGE